MIVLQSPAGEAEPVLLGDKSGPSLYHVSTLLEWYPDAKIIHTFRDPRAVLTSLLKMRHRFALSAVDHLDRKVSPLLSKLVDPFLFVAAVLYITIAWIKAVKLHYKYEKQYPRNYCMLKFEDLVAKPEENVKMLCDFLGISFTPAMLNPPQADSSYPGQKGSGFDRRTLGRWKNHLSPWLRAWVLLWSRRHLKTLGYVN
jgi:hypothetical protein